MNVLRISVLCVMIVSMLSFSGAPIIVNRDAIYLDSMAGIVDTTNTATCTLSIEQIETMDTREFVGAINVYDRKPTKLVDMSEVRELHIGIMNNSDQIITGLSIATRHEHDDYESYSVYPDLVIHPGETQKFFEILFRGENEPNCQFAINAVEYIGDGLRPIDETQMIWETYSF